MNLRYYGLNQAWFLCAIYHAILNLIYNLKNLFRSILFWIPRPGRVGKGQPNGKLARPIQFKIIQFFRLPSREGISSESLVLHMNIPSPFNQVQRWTDKARHWDSNAPCNSVLGEHAHSAIGIMAAYIVSMEFIKINSVR